MFGLLLLLAGPASAQRRSATDAQIVEQAVLVASGDRVEIYQHGVTVTPAFLATADAAYRRIEPLIGRPLDTATLGPKVRIYISDAVRMSHVWHGYEHPKDPKGIVFLSPRVYEGALRRNDATYVHEISHLFTWRYHSHTLREGFADYLALQVHPGAAIGPNAQGYDWSAKIPADIAEFLRTTKPAPTWLGSDAGRRRTYYFASYRFVKSLIEKAGMQVFLQLYDSPNTEEALAALYGATRDELVRRALAP